VEEKKQIVIAEDHAIVREGLRSLLSSSTEFEVVEEAADGLEAVRCVERHCPDLLLLDLTMPKMNGVEIIREVKRRSPGTKVLVLTVQKSEEHVHAAFQSGADGYCLKDARYNELLTAIRNVASGKPYISPGVAGSILEGYMEGKKTSKSGAPWETLTKREREILKLIGEGYKNREIAEDLCISTKTVERHRANLMKKLDLHNTAALTTYAIEKGLVAK
jgi:DNA-binding NarL/FixJ family response regulator